MDQVIESKGNASNPSIALIRPIIPADSQDLFTLFLTCLKDLFDGCKASDPVQKGIDQINKCCIDKVCNQIKSLNIPEDTITKYKNMFQDELREELPKLCSK